MRAAAIVPGAVDQGNVDVFQGFPPALHLTAVTGEENEKSNVGHCDRGALDRDAGAGVHGLESSGGI
jgi:hypothetical protein